MAAGVWALSSGFCQETVTKRRDTSTAFSSLGDAGSLCRSDLSAPAGSAAACGDRVVGRGVSGVGARVKAVGQGGQGQSGRGHGGQCRRDVGGIRKQEESSRGGG